MPSAGPAFTSAPTLHDAGIGKKLSSRSQRLAAISAPEFEAIVIDWVRGRRSLDILRSPRGYANEHELFATA
jgi:hypothetical protein